MATTPDTATPPPRPPRAGLLRRGWVVCALVVGAAGLALLALGNKVAALLASDWVVNHRWLGALLMVPAEALWIVLGGPTTPVELVIGFVFGLPGLLINTLGKFGGCCSAFALGRFCFREFAAETFASPPAAGEDEHPRAKLFQAVKALLTGPQQVKMLLLIQLAFVPIVFKNYGLAVMPAVPMGRFAVTSLVGELPSTLALVGAGMSARNIKELLDGSAKMTTPQILAMGLASASLVVVLVVVGLKLRNSMSGQGDASSISLLELSTKPPSQTHNTGVRGDGPSQPHVRHDGAVGRAAGGAVVADAGDGDNEASPLHAAHAPV